MGKNGNEEFKTEKKSREGKIYMHKHIKYRYTFRCCVFIVESKRKKNSEEKNQRQNQNPTKNNNNYSRTTPSCTLQTYQQQ